MAKRDIGQLAAQLKIHYSIVPVFQNLFLILTPSQYCGSGFPAAIQISQPPIVHCSLTLNRNLDCSASIHKQQSF